MVNSRPLTYLYDDPAYCPLRPIDFLAPVIPGHDRISAGFPPFQEEDEDSDDPSWKPPTRDAAAKLVTTWSRKQSALRALWDRFCTEYLPSLRELHHWDHPQPHNAVPAVPNVGDVVLVQEENQPRSQWKLGKIETIRHGRDGAVRDVEVQLSTGNLSQRPISQLYPVECGTPEQSKTFTGLIRTSRPPLSSSLALALCLVALFLPVVSGGNALNVECPHGVARLPVLSQFCVQKGVVIFLRQDNQQYCWGMRNCGRRHLNGFGICSQSCPCPDWAVDCYFYNGTFPTPSPDALEALAADQPSVCSWTPSPSCDNKLVHTKFLQIERLTGEKHFVQQLRLAFTEPVGSVFECVGEGDNMVGPPSFCETHECTPGAPVFCFYRDNEMASYLTIEGHRIPIFAYGLVDVKFYGLKPLPTPSCASCKLQCLRGGGVAVTNLTRKSGLGGSLFAAHMSPSAKTLTERGGLSGTRGLPSQV